MPLLNYFQNDEKRFNMKLAVANELVGASEVKAAVPATCFFVCGQ